MRPLVLVALTLSLTACDSSEPAGCRSGPETELGVDDRITSPSQIHYRITSPSPGDTLRIGEPFRFRADVEAVGNVSGVGVALVDERLGLFPGTTLFEQPLDGEAGTFVIDTEVLLDSVRAGADLSEVYVVGTGNVPTYTACGGGGYGNAGSNAVRVTVLG
ncbi:hypothetical protein RQM47_13775 [Rubrivirga sp. S365]|uniref:Lipoprotein n=1 Tax=Rubrivirga litoralis TaxID=3075598 RepID=A0ABU3BMP1_9BACT|nr:MULTISPECIES: hypothetical protein [unclassified Rubrivirga]MDT0630572.1 hypothetical protein [Rubrivirga sp. F394]MDT7857716.1 hypothetical protein [Rubrivirga sp. S365]